MSLSLVVRRTAVGCLLTAAFPALVLGQSHYLPIGGEYPLPGALPGDQVFPAQAVGPNGGFLVWQDNITDGDGAGISAVPLDANFSPSYGPFRVNSIGAGNQENPQVALLSGGGAVFAWQGGLQGAQHIYARFLSPNNTWVGADVQASSATKSFQANPVLAPLANGNVVVAYASYNQFATNSMRDIYGQVLSPDGQKVGGEFLVNQFTKFNQRDPAAATLAGGQVVMVWVSEQQRAAQSIANTPLKAGTSSVDIYARFLTAAGVPQGFEFLVNGGTNVCSTPRVAASADGGFMVVWAERNPLDPVSGWNIVGRTFSATGVGNTPFTLNTQLTGDQFGPAVAFDGKGYLVTWTSLGQDKSQEGIFGQFVRPSGMKDGGEFQVNTTWVGPQMQSAVAGDGQGHFLATWTSFGGGINSFDLFGQAYVSIEQPLLAMNAPYVWVPFDVVGNLYQPEVQVSWPLQAAVPVDHYEIYMDGVTAFPVASVTNNNTWTMTSANGLAPNTSHTFQVGYVTVDGRQSPLSLPASGKTWSGLNIYGIPSEWLAQYYGWNMAGWPSVTAPLAPGGPNLQQVFLTGANPLDSSTWLKVRMVGSSQGYFLTWNPEAGMTYQVQSSTNLSTWSNVGAPRFAAGSVDSIYIGLDRVGYYRVLRLR